MDHPQWSKSCRRLWKGQQRQGRHQGSRQFAGMTRCPLSYERSMRQIDVLHPWPLDLSWDRGHLVVPTSCRDLWCLPRRCCPCQGRLQDMLYSVLACLTSPAGLGPSPRHRIRQHTWMRPSRATSTSLRPSRAPPTRIPCQRWAQMSSSVLAVASSSSAMQTQEGDKNIARLQLQGSVHKCWSVQERGLYQQAQCKGVRQYQWLCALGGMILST